jgi:LemA protein
MGNSKFIIPLIVLFAIIILPIFYAVSAYNGIITEEENVKSLFAQVDNNLKRRNDLIPNLVSTVQGYVKQEKEIFTNVANARAKLSGANSITEKAAANGELSSALSRLLVITENYPQLKSNENFKQLSDELAGTENRIAVARRDYNEGVKKFNLAIKRFPKSILAGLFGFKEMPYFETTNEEKAVPKVKFE